MTRYLIVNADDFGRSPGVNRGVAVAHEQGIVTSASLMVRWPAGAKAAAYAHTRPELSVGLHVDLAESLRRTGEWAPMYQHVPLDDERAVAAEIERQLEAFRALLNRNPTHLDAHQHVHRQEPTRSIMLALAMELGVPLREFSPHIRHCGSFYGQMSDGSPLPDHITVDGLIKTLQTLPPGITELGCHPAAEADFDSMYGVERERELRTLCDPTVYATVQAEGIELRSFAQIRKMRQRVPDPSRDPAD